MVFWKEGAIRGYKVHAVSRSADLPAAAEDGKGSRDHDAGTDSRGHRARLDEKSEWISEGRG